VDLTTLIGIIAGIVFIIIGIELEGNIGNFYDVASILITLGGTVAATLIHYPFSQIARFGGILMKVFTYKRQDVSEGIRIILDFAVAARREGLLTLEARAGDIEDRYLKKGIMLIVDGTNPELVRNMMETELNFIEERHKQGQSILESMASYAPAFGLIGTLIGLINMLKHLNDPSSLGPAMAVALITTFYGAILANMIFLPMAGKLKSYTSEEILYKEVILEGILSIQAGENPRIIEEKLNAFIASPKKGRPRQAVREVGEVNA
jgi:chemotaxis protein MotA